MALLQVLVHSFHSQNDPFMDEHERYLCSQKVPLVLSIVLRLVSASQIARSKILGSPWGLSLLRVALRHLSPPKKTMFQVFNDELQASDQVMVDSQRQLSVSRYTYPLPVR